MEFVAEKKRIEWVDIAKGILILLVVLGHFLEALGYYEFVHKWIYSFHMVSFFALSGVVFKEYNIKPLAFIRKKFRSLIIPAYIAFFITAIYSCFQVGFHNLWEWLSIKNIISVLVLHNYWFIGALFSLEIIEYFLHKVFLNGTILLFISFMLLCFGIACKQIIPNSIDIPFSIIQGAVCAPFFELGFQFKGVLNRLKFDSLLKKFLFIFVSFGVSLFSVILYPYQNSILVYAVEISDIQWFLICVNVKSCASP